MDYSILLDGNIAPCDNFSRDDSAFSRRKTGGRKRGLLNDNTHDLCLLLALPATVALHE